ncbi:hypothetical protein F2Q68_00003733 [Brassica cretica]|uniref:Poly A polymerase head domain-containing protein n=1 Tax=Brassica cretica TaxID=69181 RepID=A0A8S9J8I2_BRACR|nr:hypothetical protein F2Q68_00003733 [Brassica cretica]
MGGGIRQLLEQVHRLSRRCLFRVLSMGPLPTHLAFIMDGNRRYAKKRGLEDGSGHKAGFSALMSMLQYCYELGIKYVTRRGNAFFRSQTLAAIYSKLQRSNCTLAEGVMEKCSVIEEDINSVDTSKWKKVRAIDCGIRNSMVPESSLNVLRLLRRQGFDAYLVGGCVRDLILHRPPKDYDVITTANLKQIRRLFHRAQVVGRRFPICHVWMKGSVIEVSSFNTVAQSDTEHENDTRGSKESSNLFKMYSGWDAKDCNLWRNSLQRDFTVNSLFFDPFELKIYDYNNGMEDLKDLKLRTLIPAHVSFSEDCARVLRGLRLSARLGLSLSKDIKTAIPESISSVANLNPNQDQSVVQKPKRLRRHKEALVPEALKQKTSKRSKSYEQETVESLSGPLVSDPPKQKTSKNRLKETQKVECGDISTKEIQDAKLGFVSDKSMSDLLKVLVKPSQQASSKEESNSLPSSEKTKKPRKLSSLFR